MDVSIGGGKLTATMAQQHATLVLQMALDRKRAGHNLAALRDSKHITQAELAQQTGISLRQIQRYESGASMPRWRTLDTLAEALGNEVYAIVRAAGEDEEQERPPTPDPYAGGPTQADRIEQKLDYLICFVTMTVGEQEAEAIYEAFGPPPDARALLERAATHPSETEHQQPESPRRRSSRQ